MLYDNFEDLIEGMGADYVYREYNKVRESGKCNMFVMACVVKQLLNSDKGRNLGLALLHSNGNELYAGILNNWSKYNE